MADDQAEKKPEATADKAKGEALTYTVERLTEESGGILGVPSHVAVGALHGSKKKNLTVAEAKAAVDEFLKKPEEGKEATE